MPEVTTTNIVVDHTELIHIKNVFSAEECERISSQILTYKENHTPAPSEIKMSKESNGGCWRGEPWQQGGFTDADKDLILSKILKSFDHFVNTMPIEQQFKDRIFALDRTVYMWANVNPTGTDNLIHKHLEAFMSGVLYFQTTGTGDIEFISSIWLDSNTCYPWPWARTHKIPAEDGDMVVFPGYLFHQVKINLSNRNRINIAFNVMLKE